MKKSTKTKAIALAFITGSLLTGCGSTPDDFQTVYGPPQNITTSSTEDYNTTETETTEDTTESITTESNYNPEEEIPQDVYGPPHIEK